MPRKTQSCIINGCLMPRCDYSMRNMCREHDERAEAKGRAEYEASPRGRAEAALEDCKTGADLKDFIREHLLDALSDH